MADGLMDLGGGVKMMDVGSTLQNAISLQSLRAQTEGNQLATKKLEIETALKANELMNLNVANLLQRAQLNKALGDEHRAQARHVLDIFKQIDELFTVNPEAGQAALAQIAPEATVRIDDDNTGVIEWPIMKEQEVDGKVQMVPWRDSLPIHFGRKPLTTEQKDQFEGQGYQRFQSHKDIQTFQDIHPFYQQLKQASDSNNRQADLILVGSFIKMIAPNARFNPGDPATVDNMKNVPEGLADLYKKIFGGGESGFSKEARANFISSADLMYANARENALLAGRDLASWAKRKGLDPRNIVTPVGDITEEQFSLTREEIEEKLRRAMKDKPGDPNATGDPNAK